MSKKCLLRDCSESKSLPSHLAYFANPCSAKLYEIGAGTTEVRKIVIGRVSSYPLFYGESPVVNLSQAFNKEYSSFAA